MTKIVSENSEQVIVEVSNSIIALAKACIAESGKFTIALSGGNTPKLLYQYLISQQLFNNIDLSKITIYFSDERYVAHSDERSNYGLAKKYLLEHLEIPAENIFPVDTSFDDLATSCERYQNTIMANVVVNSDNIPAFDLIILGMGPDGHTASLFPESKLLESSDILVGSCFHQESNTNRISFTFPLINAAKNIAIIAIGAGKYEILKDIEKAESNNNIKYPIQRVKPKGKLNWYIDRAAEQGE